MAQKALFITIQDVKQKSIISGNVDPDKVVQFVEVAQDTHIQNYLGGTLYKKLQTLILNNTINDAGNVDYKTLLDEYIKPMLIWFTQSNYLPFAAYQVGNGGIYKHRSENADTISTDELNMLINRASETAEFYTRNSQLYPEYTTVNTEDMQPDKDVGFHSWYLG
jgi:hypothetical protein